MKAVSRAIGGGAWTFARRTGDWSLTSLPSLQRFHLKHPVDIDSGVTIALPNENSGGSSTYLLCLWNPFEAFGNLILRCLAGTMHTLLLSIPGVVPMIRSLVRPHRVCSLGAGDSGRLQSVCGEALRR